MSSSETAIVMSADKWSSDTIIQFLEEYLKHPCLWDCTHPKYKYRKGRIAAELSILKAMKMEDLDLNTFRNKVRHIRNTYRQEVEKIAIRRKNGLRIRLKEGLDSNNKPRLTKLAWFYVADVFLRKTLETQYVKPTRDEMARERGEEFSQLQEQTTMQVSNPDSPDERPTATKTHFITVKPSRRKLSDDVHHHHHHLEQQQQVYQDSSAEYHQLASTSTAEVKDEFSIFADYVASELRTIGERRALAVAKHNINTVLFEATTGMYDQQQQSNGDQ